MAKSDPSAAGGITIDRFSVVLVAVATYRWGGSDNLAGGIATDYALFTAKTRWGLPVMTDEEAEVYRREHSKAE